ncbi:hypothetical protein A8W25_05115 [Streptomyces sp. ERV7]|nr:hypothetical protein A8W25_05115 [Streptomyces sp. ERV7]
MSEESALLTTTASAISPGELWQASVFLLPDETTQVIPAAMDFLIAASSLLITEVLLMLILTTAGLAACAVIQSAAAMIADVLALSWQSVTRTATSLTPLATPWSLPPTVPATWVPWPRQSWPPRPSPTSSTPMLARPWNWAWVVRSPLSTRYTVTLLAVVAYV